jgi:hypothetical protein
MSSGKAKKLYRVLKREIKDTSPADAAKLHELWLATRKRWSRQFQKDKHTQFRPELLYTMIEALNA